jgi:hypothetical protein
MNVNTTTHANNEYSTWVVPLRILSNTAPPNAMAATIYKIPTVRGDVNHPTTNAMASETPTIKHHNRTNAIISNLL